MVSSVYKVGMWLKDKQSGQLWEIIAESQKYQSVLLKSFTPRPLYQDWSTHRMIDKFEIAPLARLLYSNNVTTNRGDQDETDEK